MYSYLIDFWTNTPKMYRIFNITIFLDKYYSYNQSEPKMFLFNFLWSFSVAKKPVPYKYSSQITKKLMSINSV